MSNGPNSIFHRVVQGHDVLDPGVMGRWELYARSGFTREPLAQWPQQWPMLYFACLSQANEA